VINRRAEAVPADTDNPEEYTDNIVIDVKQIPDFQRDELVEPLLPLLAAFYAQPGVQEKYDAWLKARKSKLRRST
jgi:hypothetical protein